MKWNNNLAKTITVTMILLVFGCQKSAVDTVQDAVFDNYPGVSIGKAFDNRFENVSWEETQSPAGQVLVVFHGTTPANANEDVRGADKKIDALQYSIILDQTRWQMIAKATYTDKSKVKPLQEAKDLEEIMNIVMPPGSQIEATFLVENMETGRVNLVDCKAPSWWATGCTQELLLELVFAKK